MCSVNVIAAIYKYLLKTKIFCCQPRLKIQFSTAGQFYYRNLSFVNIVNQSRSFGAFWHPEPVSILWLLQMFLFVMK